MASVDHFSFWECISGDAAAHGIHIDPNAPFLTKFLAARKLARRRPGFACVWWLRINQLFAKKGWRGAYRIRIWRTYRFANDISEYAHIAPGLLLPHPVDVTVGSAVRIGRNAVLYNGVTLGSRRHGGDNAMPKLGDHVIVYTGAKIFGPVEIGDHCEVGALALLTKNLPTHSVMYGIPPNVTIKEK